MNKGTITAPAWFARWVKEAENRRLRQRQVEEAIDMIGSILMAIGVMVALLGIGWIDSMDVTKTNVIITFGGVGLAAVGSRIKWVMR